MAGGECPLAIKYDGEVVIVEGTDSMTGFGENDPGVLMARLQYDDIHSGCVAIRVAPSCASSDFGRLLDFIAYSIQELIDMERARRSHSRGSSGQVSRIGSVAPIGSEHQYIPAHARRGQRTHRRMPSGKLSRRAGHDFSVGTREGSCSGWPFNSVFPFGSYLQPMAESALFNEVVHSDHGEIINDLSKEKRWDNELPGLSSMILIPISSPNRCEGMLILASENTGVFEAAHRRSLSTLASVAGISVSNSFNFEGIQKLMNAILQALAEAIDSRDPFTAGHSERVAHLAVAFAHAMNEDGGHKGTVFSDDELREIYYAGILHDVGKIGIKEEVLTKRTRLSDRRMEVVRARFQLMGQFDEFNWSEAYECLCDVNKAMNPESKDLEFIKSLGSRVLRRGETYLPYLHEDELEHLLLSYGNLTKDERKEIQRHPAESERILQHIPMHDNYSNMLTIIRQHHERMDGSGYPDGLEGGELLIQSRLMAIVDIYDAVTQERHYKPAYTRSEAVKILREEVATGQTGR